MKRTIEMILMTLLIVLVAVFVGSTMTSCSSSDVDDSPVPTICPVDGSFFAVIDDPEGGQRIDLIPQDYVLTFDDIVYYVPETGELVIKGGDEIEAKSYPIPKQWKITFYLNNQVLFSAWLNSMISSLIGGTGLMLYYNYKDDMGYTRLQLRQITIGDENGNIIAGELTEEEKAGLAMFEQLLEDHGKCLQIDNNDY